MKVILRHHGLKLSGAKADLYTAIGRSIIPYGNCPYGVIGLDSKHPAGIPSTVSISRV